MSDTSQGPGWWQASDGKWYPPESAPGGGTPAGGGYAGAGSSPDVGGAISYGWSKFSQNVGPLIVAYLVMIVVNVIINGIGFATNSLLLRLLINLVAIVVSAVASFGLANVALKIVRGEAVEVSDALPSGPTVMSYAITAILVQVIVTVGLYIYVIPGVIAAGYLWWAHFLAIEEGLKPGDALSRSAQLAKGNLGAAIGFVIVAFLINVVGFILCFVGTFVTVPLTTVAAAHFYKGLKGEPVAA